MRMSFASRPRPVLFFGLSLALLLSATMAFAAGGEPATQLVDNPYGLDALWAQGDFVAKGTLLILATMSAWSWYILVTKLIEQSSLLRGAGRVEKSFWKSASLSDGAGALAEGSPFRDVVTVALGALEQREGPLVEQIDLNTWVTVRLQRQVDRITGRLQSGLAVLATVASTAPFVGLFGTVWGIYHALTAIGIAGQASIDKVAGPVGEALIMTAIGLAVAVPAVLGYNWLSRRNKAAIEKVRAFGTDIHSILQSSGRLGELGRARPVGVVKVA